MRDPNPNIAQLQNPSVQKGNILQIHSLLLKTLRSHGRKLIPQQLLKHCFRPRAMNAQALSFHTSSIPRSRDKSTKRLLIIWFLSWSVRPSAETSNMHNQKNEVAMSLSINKMAVLCEIKFVAMPRPSSIQKTKPFPKVLHMYLVRYIVRAPMISFTSKPSKAKYIPSLNPQKLSYLLPGFCPWAPYYA